MSDRAIDYGRFEALTFDCYGTLIDWETGILAGLRKSLAGLDDQPSDDELLERYGRAESALESGPYLRYREIVARCLGEVCRGYGVEPTERPPQPSVRPSPTGPRSRIPRPRSRA